MAKKDAVPRKPKHWGLKVLFGVLLLAAFGYSVYDYAAFERVATGTAGHLHQRCKQTLGRPEIGTVKTRITIDHHDQTQAPEVVALGQHLSADQQIDFALVNRSDNRLGSPPATSHVAKATRAAVTRRDVMA
jgi:hypothetical protein